MEVAQNIVSKLLQIIPMRQNQSNDTVQIHISLYLLKLISDLCKFGSVQKNSYRVIFYKCIKIFKKDYALETKLL